MMTNPAPCQTSGGGGTTQNWISNDPLNSTLDNFRYKTNNKFDPTNIHVYHLGRRLELGMEYICEESGGLGTGFDQIKLVNLQPNARSRFFADYVQA